MPGPLCKQRSVCANSQIQTLEPAGSGARSLERGVGSAYSTASYISVHSNKSESGSLVSPIKSILRVKSGNSTASAGSYNTSKSVEEATFGMSQLPDPKRPSLPRATDKRKLLAALRAQIKVEKESIVRTDGKIHHYKTIMSSAAASVKVKEDARHEVPFDPPTSNIFYVRPCMCQCAHTYAYTLIYMNLTTKNTLILTTNKILSLTTYMLHVHIHI